MADHSVELELLEVYRTMEKERKARKAAEQAAAKWQNSWAAVKEDFTRMQDDLLQIAKILKELENFVCRKDMNSVLILAESG